MSRQRVVGGMLALALSMAVGSAGAHHAFSAEFDAKQPVEVKGVVTKTKWVNPHSWIYVDVKDKDGAVTNWGFEFGSISALERLGLTRAVVAIGSEITLKGYRSRNGGPFGYTVNATLADGRTFQLGSPQDGAPVAATTP